MFVSRPFVRVSIIGLAVVALASCEALEPLFQPDEPEEGAGSSVSLSWQAPTVNADGTPLGDLAGFRIYYGTASPLTVENATVVDLGDVTSYTASNLQPGVYYFAVSAVDQNGNASSLSEEVSAEIIVQ